MAARIQSMHKRTDHEVTLIAEHGNVAGNISKIDDEIEIHFPVSGVFLSKEQAALVAAHIITLITT